MGLGLHYFAGSTSDAECRAPTNAEILRSLDFTVASMSNVRKKAWGVWGGKVVPDDAAAEHESNLVLRRFAPFVRNRSRRTSGTFCCADCVVAVTACMH